jgi:hypothetical protein
MKWDNPQEVDLLSSIFPGSVCGTLLPPLDEIPNEFKQRSNLWARKASDLFFNGGQLPNLKPGIDPSAAKGHLSAVLGSFEPAHEHKQAGAGYLMSLWYEEPKAKSKTKSKGPRKYRKGRKAGTWQ